MVKARQVGISTGISGLVYHHTATRRNISSLISSHDLDSSNNIYGMYRMFYDYTEDYFRPMTKYSNRKEILFENPKEEWRRKYPGLNSRIIVDTSANTKVGRSFTLQNCHLSEVAYMENPEELMMGIEEAVPFTPGTSIFLESTANGLGDFFYKRCEMAAEGKGAYTLVFIPWFWESGYSVPESQVSIGTLGESEKDEYGNEKELVEQFNLTKGQLQWRRDKIEGSFDGNAQKFCQEYPSTWREAFIFSGQPMFPVKMLLAMKDQCPQPLYRADIAWTSDMQFRKLVSPSGALSVWSEPKPNETYVLGVDVAEGIDGGDNSVIDVLDVRGMEQVAQWCGLIPPDELAYIASFLGTWYHNALIGPEVNNHGLTTIVALQKLRYWNIYKRTIFDKVLKKRRDSIGWKTTATTKPLLIDGLRQIIREGELLVNSKESISEMLTYVKLDNGQLGATGGHKDDRVIALALAVEMSKQTFLRSRAVASLPKPFLTMDDAAKMADDLYNDSRRPLQMGAWHKPLND